MQCLQRVYGGSESWLRSRGTMFALQKLYDKEHISSKDFHNLTNAYEFLRNLEHRLQLRHGQQTHRLPESRRELQALARSLAREGTAAPTPEEFLAHVQRRMAAVAEIYQRVIYQEQSQDRDAPEFQLHPEIPATPESSYSQMMQRLAVDSPRLREIAGSAELSQHARRNLDRFLSSAGTTSERYGAVLRSPEAVDRALTIFEFSEYLTDILVRHPAEVSLLPQIEELSNSGRGRIVRRRSAKRERHDRSRFRLPGPGEGRSLRGERDLATALPPPRVPVGRARSVSVARSLRLAKREHRPRPRPRSRLPWRLPALPPDSRSWDWEGWGPANSISCRTPMCCLFATKAATQEEMHRVAAQMMDALTAYTHDGTVFPVDARLRPHGREGELIVTPTQLAAYFQRRGQALGGADVSQVAPCGGRSRSWQPRLTGGA